MSFIEKYNVDETFIIKDLATLKKMAHPQRIEILQILHSPKTVKDIAKEIEADPTKLYYHIRQMEQAKIIKVVETKIVSGIVEKTYFVTAKNYTVDKNLFAGEQGEASEEDFSNLIGAMFSSTQQQAKRSAKAGLIDLNEEDSQHKTVLMSSMYNLTDEQLNVFHERLQTVLEEIGEMTVQNHEAKRQESQDYVFTMAFFRKAPSEAD